MPEATDSTCRRAEAARPTFRMTAKLFADTVVRTWENSRHGGICMSKERLGSPLSHEGLEPVSHEGGDREPGFGWVLNDASRRAIEAVEENLRSAEQRTGSVILR